MVVLGDHQTIDFSFSLGFEAKEYFREGRTEFWFFPSFRDIFVSRVGSVLQSGRGTIRCATVTTDKKEVSDTLIEAELPEDHTFFPSEVCLIAASLMDRQQAGEEGALADDNVFYTGSRLARILRFSHSSRWHLSTWKRGEIAWRKGDRVWFP